MPKLKKSTEAEYTYEWVKWKYKQKVMLVFSFYFDMRFMYPVQ